LGRERSEDRPPQRGGGHGASSGDGRVLCRGGAPGSNGGFVELPGKVWKLARACARVEEGREQGLHGEVFAAARAAAAGFWAGRRGALGSGHGLGQRGRKGEGAGMGAPVKWKGESSRGERREKRRRRPCAWSCGNGRGGRPRGVREQDGGSSAGRSLRRAVACARGIDGRPRSAAQAAHGRPVWAPRRRGGASPCSCRGVSVNGQGAARTACALKWRGRQRRGTAGQQGSEAARARQRRSTASSARATAFKCLRPRRQGRASGGEREEREKESGERKPKVNCLT